MRAFRPWCSTLTVGPGQGFSGWGYVDDPVDCQGTITATPGGFITVRKGVSVSGGGTVDLGTSDLNVTDGHSSISGGSLKAGALYVTAGLATFMIQGGGQVSTTSGYVGGNYYSNTSIPSVLI